MSTKKRVADFQLTKDEDLGDDKTLFASSSETTAATTQPSADTHVAGGFGFGAYSKINPFAALTAAGTNGFNIINHGASAALVTGLDTEASATVPSFGFGTYASTKPFVAVTATVPPFVASSGSITAAAAPPISSLNFGNSAGLSSFAAPLHIAVPVPAFAEVASSGTSSTPAGAVSAPVSTFSFLPALGSAFSSYTTKAPLAVSIPSPLTLSPKAQNPFSNPSPKHNPFVTIVESKDNLWSAASRSSCTSTTDVPGTSSFPFPSSAASSSKSISTSTGLQDSIEDRPEKGAFGFDSTARIPIQPNVNGDDEESNLLVNDEYADDQVYGKVYPMPDNVMVVTGEEDEDCVIQIRAKLFRLSVPGDVNIARVESSSNSSSSASIDLFNDAASASDKNEHEKSKEENNVQNAKANPCAISTESNGIELKENPEVKKKVLGEWIEVGIGPVRILQPRDSPTSHCSEVSRNNHAALSNISNKRMVMRREDKKGGKGTKLLLNILLKGYIIVKKQGDRTFHITCLSENTLAGNNLDSNSRSFSSVDLTTYMIQTKQPQEADRLFEAIDKIVTLDRNARL